MGRRIYSDTVGHGINFDKGDYPDNKFVRCSRCGWICNIDRDPGMREGSSSGWGMRYPTDGTLFDDPVLSYDDVKTNYDGSNINDPVVKGGCPQCGTYLYK